ncbi:hypothetical protein [Methanococcus maripaludis]|uniref:Uncharacterized protein n=2 Tax=Methanococcus maripaludis TaxID=39152 RepID=A0A7J9PEZ8_METMI|nr:hypothetical protein [Methanococcus maripaludis]MBA2861842.1 hypothetical protein [Methanococcus maripaludis]
MIKKTISSLKVDEFDNFDENILFEMPFNRKIRVSNIRTTPSGKTYFFVKTDDFQEFKIYADKLSEKIEFILKKADGFVTDGYDVLKYVTFENQAPKHLKNDDENTLTQKNVLVKIPLWLANENKLHFGEKIGKFCYIHFKFVLESEKGMCFYSKELDKNVWLPKSMISYEIER